ncbi:MAG: carbohydrate kinase family protein [Candidatus Bathyarchaeia archaeon]
MFDVVVVGHFAIDSILSRTTAVSKDTLGGPPTYVSLAARKLGAKVSVLSKVGKDFSKDYARWLNANDIDLSGLKCISDAPTTRFLLRYNDEERMLQLQCKAPPITLEDVPDSLESRVIHVAPIANELSGEVVDRLRTLTQTLSLDPQGFVRGFDEDRHVFLKRWNDPHVLEQIDLYKSSSNEIRTITGLANLKLAMERIRDYGAKVVIVTKGIKGSTILYEENFYEIPACKPRAIRDLTGAGDAFIGAFLAEYTKRKDPVWCMCVGSAAASFVVEAVGPAMFGEKKDIYERASGIYEKELLSD